MKFIVLSTLLLVLVSVSCKSMAFQKLLNKLKNKNRFARLDRSLHKKNVPNDALNPQPIQTAQLSDILEQTKENAPAQESFEQDPTGQKRVFQDHLNVDLFTLVVPKSYREQSKLNKESNDFVKREVVLNQHAVYFSDAPLQDKNYRESFKNLQISEIVTSEDDIENLNCCQRVSKLFKSPEFEKRKCFTIEGSESFWTLCSESRDTIRSFRNQIIFRALASQRIVVQNPLFLDEAEEETSNWSWANQQEWPATCQTGLNQSPVSIEENKCNCEKEMKIEWGFVSAESNFPTARFNGHEIELHGDFGKFTFLEDTLETGDRKETVFHSKYITFKGKNEHDIQGADAEVEVYCETSGGKKAIVSFMIQVDNKLEYPNTFFDQANPSLWSTENGFEYVYENEVDLDDLVEGGATGFFNKSFFFYFGSTSTPPCEEGVYRFVFTNLIPITESQLDALREKSYDHKVEPKGNTRPVQAIGSRTVFQHKDTETNCAGFFNFPFDTRSGQDIKDIIEDENGFAKATKKTVTKYTHVNDKPLVKEAGDLKIEVVNHDNLSDESLEELIAGNDLSEEDLKEQVQKKMKKLNHKRK